jgi:WD40 repeat protein
MVEIKSNIYILSLYHLFPSVAMESIPVLSKYLLPSGSYIFDIDVNVPLTEILISDSSNSLSLINLHTFQCSHQFLSCHNDTITSIQFSLTDPNVIHSSSLDQTVSFWDIRQNCLNFKLKFQHEIYSTSLGLNDHLLAVGVSNEIHFYDLRNCGRPLGIYSDCHTDIVTKLAFHPTNPSIILSSGEDGLICCFNTAVPPQHDAVISIMNTECSIRDFGYFGSNDGFEGIYAISTIETLSLWHYPSAQRLSSYPNIRTGVGSDYLVDCWYQSAVGASGETDTLYLLSGSHSGEGFVHEITPSSIEPRGALESTPVPSSSACDINSSSSSPQSVGHNDTIRCVYPLGFHSPKTISLQNHSSPLTCGLLTGGEDGALCLWGYNHQTNTPTIPPPIPTRKGAIPFQRGSVNHSKQLRYNPYR